jgi:hypothetical protein
LDEQDDVGSGVGSSDADVVESAVDAQCDGSGFVDAVVTDPVVVSVSRLLPGRALGMVSNSAAGVARWGRERCGRRWLYSSDERVEQAL